MIMVGVNLGLRGAFLAFAKGSYTDGILQVTAMSEGYTFWPPLYTWLASIPALIPGVDVETGGKIISVLAASLAVLPIEAIARRLFGARAALMTAILYTISPLPLRWSVMVMTDATFMALWMGSLAALLTATAAVWPERFEQTKVKSAADGQAAVRWLLAASALGTAAALTRFQGVLLIPLIAWVIFRMMRAAGSGKEFSSRWSVPPIVTLLPWAGVAAWAAFASKSVQGHRGQIAARMAYDETGIDLSQTFLNYLFYVEEFCLRAPYFVTWGIFGFFIYGLLRIKFATTRLTLSVIAGALLTVGVVGMQSVFQSWQTRYMLPVVPFMIILAGHGISVWERVCGEKRLRYLALVAPTLVYAAAFSACVVYYQSRPFGDMREAGHYIREKVPADARIFATERYNEIVAPKLKFWSGRDDIKLFRLGQDLIPGDIIVISSYYGALGSEFGASNPNMRGGWFEYQWLEDLLLSYEANKAVEDSRLLYPANKIAHFTYSAFPILPDIMQEPLTHQNPLAPLLRYRRQIFATTILQVVEFGDEIPGEASVPIMLSDEEKQAQREAAAEEAEEKE